MDILTTIGLIILLLTVWAFCGWVVFESLVFFIKAVLKDIKDED